MTFEIETAGRTRVVEVTAASGSSQVVVDGRAHAVDVARVGNIWSLLVGPAEAGPHNWDVRAGFSRPWRSYEVAIVERSSGELTVHVNGVPVAVTVAAPGSAIGARRARGRNARPADVRRGPQPIVAPMPGRIVKVLAKVGDVVAANQGLVVVEAMKMENELRSPRAGTVTDVRAAEGALVDANAVLVVIE